MLARVAVERGRIEESVHGIASALILAQEAERKRVAAELHDGINQDVAIVAIDLGLLAQRLPQSREQIREEIARIQERTFAISTEIRNVSHDLHPAVIDQHDHSFPNRLRFHRSVWERRKLSNIHAGAAAKSQPLVSSID